ncbi:HNH endonuclease [Rheinheimera gaetbuli]
MRPVQRPACPIVQPRQYKTYLDSLLQVFGAYCSYCERPDKLDVEHVTPTSKEPTLELDWNNLLLGCPRCNRDFKKSNNDNRIGYLWPDTDNTFHVFNYLPDGRVKAVAGAFSAQAEALAELVKLEDSAHQSVLNLGRRRAFKIANHMLNRYRTGSADISEVIDNAEAGFWSVWMTVFSSERSVVDALTDSQNFPGTARSHFI